MLALPVCALTFSYSLLTSTEYYKVTTWVIGLVFSYYIIIVVTIITTWYEHVEQDCTIKFYQNNVMHFQMLEQNVRVRSFEGAKQVPYPDPNPNPNPNLT